MVRTTCTVHRTPLVRSVPTGYGSYHKFPKSSVQNLFWGTICTQTFHPGPVVRSVPQLYPRGVRSVPPPSVRTVTPYHARPYHDGTVYPPLRIFPYHNGTNVPEGGVIRTLGNAVPLEHVSYLLGYVSYHKRGTFRTTHGVRFVPQFDLEEKEFEWSVLKGVCFVLQ